MTRFKSTKFFIHQTLALLLLTSFQTSCESKADSGNQKKQKIHLFIWGEYTSPTVFRNFFEQTGIEIVESNFASNEEMLAKIQTGADGYDLIVPSDYMVTVMTKLGLLTPLDKTKIPNLKNIERSLLNQPYDPKNTYSVPYAWSLVGIAFNGEKINTPVETYQDLFSRQELTHRFSILDDSREMMGSALKSRGLSANTTNDQELKEIKDLLLMIKKRCREFNSAPTSQLLQGDLIAAQMYSNEALKLAQKFPKFHFSIPRDGFTMAIDNMVIPRASKHPELAYKLINYLMDPAVNLQFSTDVLIAPVVQGVYNQLPKSLSRQPAIGPVSVITAKSEMIFDLGDATKKYDRMWTELKVNGN
jgi:spermidine/putrescine transport system substrate-binding protein